MNQEQITSSIIMVRPANFGFNVETAKNNAFQKKIDEMSASDIKKQALIEFDQMVDELRTNGIEVTVWEDTESPIKPDAVFPNNWFTTHADNSIITYPMYAPLRQQERRDDLLEQISESTTKRYGFEYFEEKQRFLEGTGSMILDRENKIVYACLSQRTDVEILNKFAVLKGYKKVHFDAVDLNGDPVYHTNVIMALGEDFVAICLDCVKDEDEKAMLIHHFNETNKEIVDLTFDQINAFSGNMIQLKNKEGKRFVVMSKQAKQALTKDQRIILEKSSTIISPDITTIETIGGGSARCMIAENYLPAFK